MYKKNGYEWLTEKQISKSILYVHESFNSIIYGESNMTNSSFHVAMTYGNLDVLKYAYENGCYCDIKNTLITGVKLNRLKCLKYLINKIDIEQ
jgi:hypothetical protein